MDKLNELRPSFPQMICLYKAIAQLQTLRPSECFQFKKKKVLGGLPNRVDISVKLRSIIKIVYCYIVTMALLHLLKNM